MVKEIPLGGGFATIVDDEDFAELSKFKWNFHRDVNTVYAIRANNKSYPGPPRAQMHRLITGAPDGVLVDHINRNGLDNRRCNLRFVNRNQNQANRGKQKNNTSGFKGVTYRKSRGVFYAQIKVRRRMIYLGSARTAEGAARLYDIGAKKYFGEYAYLNFG